MKTTWIALVLVVVAVFAVPIKEDADTSISVLDTEHSADDGHNEFSHELGEDPGTAEQDPEDGGSMVPGVVQPEIVAGVKQPHLVYPETGHVQEEESTMGFGSGSGAEMVWDPVSSYTNRREGYAEVAQYLDQLNAAPASGSGTSLGSAMQTDPELAEIAMKIDAQRTYVQKARDQILHAEKMKTLLKEDRRAVLSAAPFEPNKLQQIESQTQLKRLDAAIAHEDKAGSAWLVKQHMAAGMLAKFQAKQLKLQKSYVVQDAKLREKWLKKIAREHVDFNLWRASHTGPENESYLRWKQTQKVQQATEEHNAEMEQIRMNLEASLEKKMRDEFTNVKHAVEAAKNHSAAMGVMESIESMAGSKEYDQQGRTDKAERNANSDTRDLEQKLDDDTKWYQMHVNKAKAFQGGLQRKHLESNQQKIERLKGLYLAGIVRNKNDKVKKRSDDGPLLSPDTNAEYEVHKAKNISSHVEEQEERRLDERVEKAEVKRRAWEKARQERTQEVVDLATEDEHNEHMLSGLRLRSLEAQAKLNAMGRIKMLNAKLAKFDGAGTNPDSQASEIKAKSEANKLKRDLSAAKIQADMARKKEKDKHDVLVQLMKNDVPDETDETKVLPDQQLVARP